MSYVLYIYMYMCMYMYMYMQVSDVGCAVHICSLLHQRYAEFSPELLEQLQKIYSTGIGKDEDKVTERVGRSTSGERESLCVGESLCVRERDREKGEEEIDRERAREREREEQ